MESTTQKFPLSRKQILIGSLTLAILICGILLSLFACKIPENVHVGGMNVGSMTLAQARKTLNTGSEAVLEHTVLTVDLPEETLHLSPADTKARLKTWKATLAAFRAREGENLPLTPYLKLDEGFLRSILADYASRYDTDLTPSHYQLQGEMPELEIEKQNDSNLPQTLVLRMGLSTTRLDQEDALAKILGVYDHAFSAAAADEYHVADTFRVDTLEEPEKVNLQAIYEDLYIPAVNDSLDMENHTMIRGSYGYGFDLDFAARMVDMAALGQTLYLPMVFLEPEVFEDEVYFTDVLGYCETPHTKDENRNHNLRMACQAMDGLILQPGDVFSYNNTLGPRTKENGYKRAGAYSGWELVMSYGGGICQGSTTIYGAVLYADLEIVERRNHGIAVSYVKPGLDATVNWGGPDFQFRNSTHFPIKITAEVSDGFVKVAILGTEERDYYVEMESEVGYGSDAIYCKSYKCKYDKEAGELISREMEARSNYMR